MSIIHAGAKIREARIKAKLSQEELSDGICSPVTLSRIENGISGVSYVTFTALMSRTGFSYHLSPVFITRSDFDCFYMLNRAEFFINFSQLSSAYDELCKIEKKNWANNKYHYQKWVLLYCNLQSNSGDCDHRKNYNMLLNAIKISRPDFNPTTIDSMFLTKTEIQIIIALANEYLYVGNISTSLELYSQIAIYLENCSMSYYDKNQLLAQNAIIYIQYLILTGNYSAAYDTANHFRCKMIADINDTLLCKLTFLTALSLYHDGKTDLANELFKVAIYTASALESVFATIGINYIRSELKNITLSSDLLSLSTPPLTHFPAKCFYDISNFNDGTYNIKNSNVLSLGDIIHELRVDQHISLETLCYGLCSKSTLSKIENNQLRPKFILYQTLLQRLGISDSFFDFFGSKHESELYTLREKTIHTLFQNQIQSFKYLDLMKKHLTVKDTLFYQYILFKKATYITNTKEKIAQFQTALSLTLPGFNITEILKYRLSWMELTILTNLGASYCESNTPTIGINYLYTIFDYLEHFNVDILLRKRITTIATNMLFRCLYSQGRYQEMVEHRNMFAFNISSITSNICLLSTTYAHFCQALGKCNKIDELFLYARYSYSCFKIYEDNSYAKLLQTSICNDFNLIID